MFNLFDIYKRHKYGIGYKSTYNYKGMNDFKYNVGETYEIKQKPVVCFNGFHYCTNPHDVLNYYPVFASSNFFEVKALGKIHVDLQEGKFATNKMKIVREITDKEEMKNLFGFHIEKQENKTIICFKRNSFFEEYTKVDPILIEREAYLCFTGPMISENTNKYYDYYIYNNSHGFRYLAETYKDSSRVIKKYYFNNNARFQ